MFTKDNARFACIMAFLFGSFLLATRPYEGPFSYAYRLCLAVGGAIGYFLLGFTPKKDREASRQAAEQNSASPANVGPEQHPRPAWMGDPQGNRRRLIIVLAVFAVLAVAVTIFLVTR